MSKIITSIPADFDVSFLKETVSMTEPEIRREGKNLVFPALIRESNDGEFRYFEVTIPFVGQPIDDYEACAFACYADLRKFFYGSWSVQMEQQLKGTFAKHQYAVRQVFPKYEGEVPAGVARFEAIKTDFWDTIDEATAKVGKTRADLPPTFNAEEMLAWARENGMDTEDIATYAQVFSAISLNLLHNGRNWAELF